MSKVSWITVMLCGIFGAMLSGLIFSYFISESLSRLGALIGFIFGGLAAFKIKDFYDGLNMKGEGK